MKVKTVLLDDDPTGVQLSRNVPMLFAWTPADIADALRDSPVVHLMTNTRALPPGAARALTRSAAAAARQAVPDCRLVLRGDSTLRAHLLEEYEGVREVAFPDLRPVLMLLPAMPSAGRVTRGGVHFQIRAGQAVPIAQTEYARDGGFSYQTSRLLAYAQHRSGGSFAARFGQEVRLDALRLQGFPAVTRALTAAAAAPGPAAVAVDAETVEDLKVALAGLEEAEQHGIPVVVRCAPTFAALLADSVADTLAPPSAAHGGVLVVCGSYVANTTRQLQALVDRTGTQTVEADVYALASSQPQVEIDKLAQLLGAKLAEHGLAVLSTPRQRQDRLRDPATEERIAINLAFAAAAIRPVPSVVITKGGITSAVTLRDGFGVRRAHVIGPVTTGVSLLTAGTGTPQFVVFPGNVGEDNTLADIVDAIGFPVPQALADEPSDRREA